MREGGCSFFSFIFDAGLMPLMAHRLTLDMYCTNGMYVTNAVLPPKYKEARIPETGTNSRSYSTEKCLRRHRHARSPNSKAALTG